MNNTNNVDTGAPFSYPLKTLCCIRRVKVLFRMATHILVKFVEIRTCSVNLGSRETVINWRSSHYAVTRVRNKKK